MTDLTSLDLETTAGERATCGSKYRHDKSGSGYAHRLTRDVDKLVAEVLRLRDPNRAMEAEYDKITAAENVLTWLLIEKLGCSDEGPYTPEDAQRHIVAALDQLGAAEAEVLRLRALTAPGEGCETTVARQHLAHVETAAEYDRLSVQIIDMLIPDWRVWKRRNRDALQEPVVAALKASSLLTRETARANEAEAALRLHAGDTLSLGNEIEGLQERLNEAEALVQELGLQLHEARAARVKAEDALRSVHTEASDEDSDYTDRQRLNRIRRTAAAALSGATP